MISNSWALKLKRLNVQIHDASRTVMKINISSQFSKKLNRWTDATDYSDAFDADRKIVVSNTVNVFFH